MSKEFNIVLVSIVIFAILIALCICKSIYMLDK
jgi:hypothetical protein